MQLHFYLLFILDLHAAKTLTMPYCAAFGCKYDSARYIYRELSYFISSGKTDSSEEMDSQMQAGWLEGHAIC